MAVQPVTLRGFSDLEAKLAELPNNVARGATTRGMRKGGDLMAEEQRRLAPVSGDGTPALRESIVVKVKSRNLTGLTEYSAALQSGGSYRDAQQALREARRSTGSEGTRLTMLIGSTSRVAHMVERGSGPRFHKSGKATGIMPAQPFMRTAWDNKWRHMLTAVRDSVIVEIGKAKGRIARKAARSGT